MNELNKAGCVLSRESIISLIHNEPPLVSGWDDLSVQVQPNGLDVRVESVWSLSGPAFLGAGWHRAPSNRDEVPLDGDGWFTLAPGPYVILLQEMIALPPDIMAFGRARSSLLRSGAALHTAVWDAGYEGRSEALMVVYNPHGFRIQRNARILQLVFMRLDRVTAGYSGRYQGENRL